MLSCFFFNFGLRQHYYVRHRIKLGFPLLPCVIEKLSNGHCRYYPIEVLVALPPIRSTTATYATSNIGLFSFILALKWFTDGQNLVDELSRGIKSYQILDRSEPLYTDANYDDNKKYGGWLDSDSWEGIKFFGSEDVVPATSEMVIKCEDVEIKEETF